MTDRATLIEYLITGFGIGQKRRHVLVDTLEAQQVIVNLGQLEILDDIGLFISHTRSFRILAIAHAAQRVLAEVACERPDDR
jgi:hypothetical protein